MACLPIVEGSDARKHFALEELERCTASGRNMAHVVLESSCGDRACGVTAAHDGHGALLCGRGHRLCDRRRAFVERRGLEYAQWPVPENGLCRRDRTTVRGNRSGTHVVH